ncbi:hypothetical protein [Burkholderia diffusa]|uniref:hypothetical protein n=1 Tax=Burkholderia diffusa TaxID=488732 RepID=UPI001589968D|nr:hypothetical protein [Burkholderia diffusa]
MNTYANALKTLAHCVLRRISLVTRDDKTKRGATACGQADGYMPYPANQVDARPLRDASMETRGTVGMRTRDLSTRDGIAAELDVMAASAQRRCGLSWELFVKLFTTDVNAFLPKLEASLRPVALEIAKTMDYATPEELERMQKQIREWGGCPHTGINPSHCPCGLHE